MSEELNGKLWLADLATMKMKRLGYEICILTGCYLLLQLSALNLPEKLQYSALPPQPISLVVLQEFQSENRTPQSKLGKQNNHE